MKKMFIGLGVVASLYGFGFSSSFFSASFNFSSTQISGSVSSSNDENNANSSGNCYNAFSVVSPTDMSYNPSIITQIQNQDFYLIITNKCKDTTNLNITLIDKNTGKDITDYSMDSISGKPIIKVKVHNAYKDLLVHFDYDKVTISKKVTCSWDDTLNKNICTETTTKTNIHKEENSTDDFAVRPDSFDVYVDNNDTFVGKPLQIDIRAIGADGEDDISTNYNITDMELDTEITDPNTYLSYCYSIVNGEIAHHRFYFKKASDNVQILINEKIGEEWAIVDEDDTNDTQRLMNEGESNTIRVNETSKGWAGAGTGQKENDPSNQTISADIRDNVNKNLKYHKMCW